MICVHAGEDGYKPPTRKDILASVSIDPVATLALPKKRASADMTTRKGWAGVGLVIGWVLLALGIYQIATLDTAALPDSDPPGIQRRSIASARNPKIVATARDRGELLPSTEELLELAPGGIRAMEAAVRGLRDAQRLNQVTSLSKVESLLDVAAGSTVSEWRKRAACYAVAGLLLEEFHSSTPAELERAGDAMLIAARLFRQNGSAEDANAASSHAVSDYEQILGDKGVSDRDMRGAVERKLARAKDMAPKQAELGR